MNKRYNFTQRWNMHIKYNINNQAKLENQLAKEQFHFALVQLLESEVIQLMKRVEALRKASWLIRSSNGEPVEIVIATESLLEVWDSELEQVLASKQTRAIYDELSKWDNEGRRDV